MISSHMFYCEECGAANPGDAAYCFACHQPIDTRTAHAVTLASASPAPAPAPAPIPVPVVPVSIAPVQVTATPLLNNRYEIICEVGQGGFGVVYKARDIYSKSQKRQVAIKQINLASLSPRQVIEATDSYNREVTLLSRLSHPNLPRIYDHFTDPEHWYLVMDFIEGETLEDYLNRAGHLSVKETLRIAEQLANVLGYLHSQVPPVIFRDVKPGNIMRTASGHLYLIDFGIARHFHPDKKRDTGALGSPGYAAPEQYGRAQSTARTDIYGLGATLTTLLLGEEDAKKQTSTPRIPGKLQRLLNQMLEPDASKRPKNMRAVTQRLQQIQRDPKKIAFRYARSLLWGTLIGSFPYSLFFLNVLVERVRFLQSLLGTPTFVLTHIFFTLWPLIIIFQLVSALLLIFTARRRLIGAGILIAMILCMVGFVTAWPFFGFFGPFY